MIVTVILRSHRSIVIFITYDLFRPHSDRHYGLNRMTYTKRVARNRRIRFKSRWATDIRTAVLQVLHRLHQFYNRNSVHDVVDHEVATQISPTEILLVQWDRGSSWEWARIPVGTENPFQQRYKK